MSGLEKLTRRDFLKRTGQVGGGLMLATHLPSIATAAGDSIFAPNVFIQVRPDSSVRIVCHRSEMGQGVRTSLQQVFADELEAGWDTVELVQAVGDKKYGDQNTDGSTSIRRHLTTLRKAGASARQLLEQAAADRWGVDRSACRAELNEVIHIESGKRLAYGDLVEAAATLLSAGLLGLLAGAGKSGVLHVNGDRGVGTLSLRGLRGARAVTLRPLDAAGQPVEGQARPFACSDHVFTIELTGTPATPWYLIQIER